MTDLSRARVHGPTTSHRIEIKLGASYPRTMPEIRWITPIYHPNISEIGMVCLGGYGTHWVPSVQLDELCIMLWDMARYHNYDIRSPYNRDAALWVASQTTFLFPTRSPAASRHDSRAWASGAEINRPRRESSRTARRTLSATPPRSPINDATPASASSTSSNVLAESSAKRQRNRERRSIELNEASRRAEPSFSRRSSVILLPGAGSACRTDEQAPSRQILNATTATVRRVRCRQAEIIEPARDESHRSSPRRDELTIREETQVNGVAAAA